MAGLTNLFADIPTDLPEELVQTLLCTPSVRIERIVSPGPRLARGLLVRPGERTSRSCS